MVYIIFRPKKGTSTSIWPWGGPDFDIAPTIIFGNAGQCVPRSSPGNIAVAGDRKDEWHNLFSLLLKLPQLTNIGTDLHFCMFCWVAIAFLIVVIENQ